MSILPPGTPGYTSQTSEYVNADGSVVPGVVVEAAGAAVTPIAPLPVGDDVLRQAIAQMAADIAFLRLLLTAKLS